MRIPMIYFQLLFVVLWYAVPALAAIPWWIIWLPTLVLLTFICIPLVCGMLAGLAIVILMGIEAWLSKRRRKRFMKERNFTCL